VHIEETIYAVDGDYFIEGISHKITPKLHKVTWTLSQAPAAETLFIVGTTRLDAGAAMAY
jgi:hypothetical protein